MHVFAFLSEKKKAGLVKHIGFSFHDTADVLDEILTEHPEVDFVQIQLNYLDWENDTIQSRKCYETAKRHGKPVIVMEPVKGGTLANIPQEEQPKHLGDISGACMEEMLLYAYQHLNVFKLILCHSEGTRFSKLIDEMVEIEIKGTHDYLTVLEKLGRPSPPIDEQLEHVLITGMFNTFFELIIHEMPLEKAQHYLKEMRAFYTAGWMKIMGQ